MTDEKSKLQQFKDDISEMTYGITAKEAKRDGVCVSCKKPPTWYTVAGMREYYISGLCEPCFDKIFSEVEDD